MAAAEERHEVQVYFYDLSGGMASALSQQLTGRHFEAIWHTAVVVYGQEFFFGSTGIEQALPGQTLAGKPIKTQSFGVTEVPKWLFDEQLSGMRESFAPAKYHLLENNCNNFASELLAFLTGQTLPDDVLELPAQFLATPLGQSLAPMLQNFYGSGAAANGGLTGLNGFGSI